LKREAGVEVLMENRMLLWKREKTWRTIRKAYDLMRQMRAGFRTQFVQAAYSECWVAWKLAKTGYNVRFHEKGCDASVIFSDSESEMQKVRFEVKHSEDNKEADKDGHGYASWVISKPQVDNEKFDLCVLVRDSLRMDEPDAAYVFKREEIASTRPVDVNPPKRDYYLWYSKYFEAIKDKYEWMRMAANPLVETLNRNPEEFKERWNKILRGELQLII